MLSIRRSLPSMFRFSVRDLLWLMLVVAVASASFVREGRLRADARKWRLAFGALEQALRVEAWQVNLDFASSEVNLSGNGWSAFPEHRGGPRIHHRTITARFAEPSAGREE